jgi:outer membrane protein insertion porin family
MPFAVATLIIHLTCVFSISQADPGHMDDSAFAWAYGSIVDSVTVTGNKNTRDHAILREMETQPGNVLNKEDLHRDIHFIQGLSSLSEVLVRAEELSPGHVALRISVRERAQILLKAILPYLKYDFETGVTYGIRWSDKNFRGRLENLSFIYTRNERNDDNVSFGWSAPWIGWKHWSVGMGVAFYSRGDDPVEPELLERLGLRAYVGIPLTESRKTFSQLLLSGSLNKSRTGSAFDPVDKERSVSPAIGYRYDTRNSQLIPTEGGSYGFTVSSTYALDGERNPYYRFINDLRYFLAVAEKSTIALYSNLNYQFGDYPEYSVVRIGGSGSLRGEPNGRFKGAHRWIGTVEWRYLFLPRVVFAVPIINEFDVGLGLVTFMDTGIVWNGSDDFGVNNLHGTAGLGVRFYSPIRDVVRLDFGFNARGDYRFHLATGIRF